MLDFKDITIQDKALFDQLKSETDRASENSFTTLFIWNRYYNLQLAREGDFLFLRFNIKNTPPQYAFPMGKGDAREALEKLFEHSARHGEKLRFRFLTEEKMTFLNRAFPGRFVFEEKRDQHDYVYESESLISLSGKKLHQKRNHVNQFMANYAFSYEKLDVNVAKGECAPLLYQYIEEKERNVNSYEGPAMRAFFDNYEALGAIGGAIRVNGKFVACSFGEPLSQDTALIQIEIADNSYRGAYSIINKLFCENEWKGFKYINREEDMGLPGLRKAKESYQPVFLVRKFFASEV